MLCEVVDKTADEFFMFSPLQSAQSGSGVMDGCEGSQLYPPTPPIMLQVNCMTPLRLHQKLKTFSSGRRDQPFQHSRTWAYTECVIGLCYGPRAASQLYAVEETKSKDLILCKIQPELDAKEGRKKSYFPKLQSFFFVYDSLFVFLRAESPCCAPAEEKQHKDLHKISFYKVVFLENIHMVSFRMLKSSHQLQLW